MDGEFCIDYIINNNIIGCIVECGVQEGKMEKIWINKLKQYNEVRDIYMFDTFSGLTEPGLNDYACESGPQQYKNKNELHNEWSRHKVNNELNNWCYCPLEKVKENLESTGYPSEKLHYIKGDVCVTLLNDQNIPKNIAILRLDTDWYESSKIELIKLYPNVVKGGVIIFDDYYFWNGQRQATDEYFNEINKKYDFVKINSQTSAIIKL
jgi:hypothetical protein